MKKIKTVKRLTRKLAKEFCLKQWRWIVKQIRAGDTTSVKDLKEQWMDDHGLARLVNHDCFYCEYAIQKTKIHQLYSLGGQDCKYCPGKVIDP